MGYIFTVMMIAALAFAGVMISKKKIEFVIPGCFFFIIFWMYFWGMIQQLPLGVYSLALLSVILSFVSAAYYIKKPEIFKECICPGLRLFLFWSAFFGIIHTGRSFWHGDEFSHWGTTVKSMYELNRLSNVADSFTSYKDYPPATALLQYVAVKLNAGFSEAHLYRILSLLLISLELPLACMLKEMNRKKIILINIIIYLIPTVFYYSYTELLVDCLLGMLFAYILSDYYIYSGQKISWMSILAAFVLTSVKSTGLFLAVIAYGIVLCDGFFTMLRNKKFSMKSVCGYVAFPAFAAFAKISWAISCSKQRIDSSWGTDEISVSNFLGLLEKGVTFRNISLRSIAIDFIKDYLYPSDALTLCSPSYILWCALFFGFIYALSKSGNGRIQYKQIKIISIGLYTGLIIFSASLLICYFFLWGEALTDGSFYRYLNTYYLGIFAILLNLIVYSYQEKFEKLAMPMIVALLILCRPLEILKTTVLFPFTRMFYLFFA